MKFLDKALVIEPDNENAQKYREAVCDKIKEIEKDIFKIDERNKVMLVRTKKMQEKDTYENLILNDHEDAENKSRKSKKKRSIIFFLKFA